MVARGYIRFPTIHKDTIVFTAEDDLWRVSAQGGRAERLTAGVAAATNARFSPDGKWIAFVGREEGPGEVYVMPAEGGPARRLTYQSARASVVGWTPDGTGILYSSSAGVPSPRWRVLYSVSPQGGEPRRLPFGVANSIAYGPKGMVVLGRNIREPAHWKRYRGGTAGHLWIDTAGDGEFARLIDLAGDIAAPCWVGRRIFFISDHDGIGNVYSCLPTGKDLRQHTHLSEFYARNLSTDGHRCVFHAGADLYLLEPTNNGVTQIEVDLPSTFAQRARKFVPAGRYLDSWNLHPQGHSVALTTRGKAFSMANWEGAVLQHGESDGPRYRLARWLADGKRVVALADDGTEPHLVVFSVDGTEPDRTLDGIDVGHILNLRAAPFGSQVVLRNHRNEIMLVDVEAGTSRVLDRSEFGRNESGVVMDGIAWSPDARWVAYSFAISRTQTIIKLCRVETGETYEVTQPVRRDFLPAFDPNGRYLYFLSQREFNPVRDTMQFEFGFPKGERPYLVTLRRDLPSPFIPALPGSEKKDETEKASGGNENEADDDKAAADGEVAADGEKKAETGAPPPIAIDLDGISSRIVAFPVAEGRYGRVSGTRDGVIFSAFPVEGTLHEDWTDPVPGARGSLQFYSFEKRKQEQLADTITDFAVTDDGKMLIYRTSERLRVVKAGEKPGNEGQPSRESGWLDLYRIKVSVRPDAEWRQMFAEAWRLQREQFWVPDMAGVDWEGAFRRYAPLVERVTTRGELSDLIWELQGELGTSHAYEFGGEYRPHPEYRQGFLGVDWRFDADTGRYVIEHIVSGDPWNADATSPLLGPGINVNEGDAVLAINGQRVTPERGPQQLLVNQAYNQVQLLIQPAAGTGLSGGGEPRTVTVRALGHEYGARYRDWVEGNRRRVHEATGNRVGYVHIPDMSSEGFAEFHRYYLTEYDYDGLIIDVRWNGGGEVSGLLLEKLARKRLGYSFQRWGPADPYFAESPRGPLVAITNENAGSDGDIFSHAFKMLNLGPLIGKRTWGGVIGISPYTFLADGTLTTQPEFSFWFRDVEWGVENYGTEPTIDVDYRPQDYANGVDPQLDRAIAEALRLVEENPAPTPTPEPHPHRGYPATSRR